MLISAGDTSGDLHAARLVEELTRRDPRLQIFALGGAALSRTRAEVLVRLADHPVMGFSQVLPSLGRFIELLAQADRWLQRARPDLLILVDYPGFNLNLAALARRRGIATCYYICPQHWGWAPWRARRLARVVDHALVIFPFEVAFWERHGVDAYHVGHPVADHVADWLEQDTPRRWVAVLPGSRRQEIKSHLPWMLAAARRLGDLTSTPHEFRSTHPDPARRADIASAARESGVLVKVTSEPLPELLAGARAALVSSGTATLEAAWMGVPSVVLYRVPPIMLWGSRWLLTAPHISQPNLLAGHEVFPEFLAARDPGDRLAQSLATLVVEGAARTRCLKELERLKKSFFQPGMAARAADRILELLPAAPVDARTGNPYTPPGSGLRDIDPTGASPEPPPRESRTSSAPEDSPGILE